MKKTKGFVLGVIFTVLTMAGAAHFGFVKIDITITDKGAAAIEASQTLVDDATTKAGALYDEHIGE